MTLWAERWDAAAGGNAGQQASLLEQVLDATGEASVITLGDRILYVNREFTRLFGYTLAECAGQELFDLVVPDGRLHEREVIQHTVRAHGRVTMETKRRTRDGGEIDVSMSIAKLQLGMNLKGNLIVYRDIRQLKLEQARLKHKARHDMLTGLPNRSLFLEQVAMTLARLRRRPDRRFAIVFLDLDGFKQVNDRHGHAAGDGLLLKVSERLTHCLRPQDTVARFGGDEFALLLDECGSDDEAETVARRIQSEIQEPVVLDRIEANVAASIGIAMAIPKCESAEELLVHADSAMYSAKSRGGACHVMYRWE